MSRNDEELKGPSRRTRGHIEESEHLEWGVCVTIPCICVVSSCLSETSRGILKVDRTSIQSRNEERT